MDLRARVLEVVFVEDVDVDVDVKRTMRIRKSRKGMKMCVLAVKKAGMGCCR